MSDLISKDPIRVCNEIVSNWDLWFTIFEPLVDNLQNVHIDNGEDLFNAMDLTCMFLDNNLCVYKSAVVIKGHPDLYDKKGNLFEPETKDIIGLQMFPIEKWDIYTLIVVLYQAKKCGGIVTTMRAYEASIKYANNAIKKVIG